MCAPLVGYEGTGNKYVWVATAMNVIGPLSTFIGALVLIWWLTGVITGVRKDFSSVLTTWSPQSHPIGAHFGPENLTYQNFWSSSK